MICARDGKFGGKRETPAEIERIEFGFFLSGTHDIERHAGGVRHRKIK
jgi:hypothetical protein